VDRQRNTTRTAVLALIRRPPGHYLIVRPTAEPDGVWTFPGAAVPPNATPEDTLRRVCHDRLGIRLTELIPQAPLALSDGVVSTTYRAFLCPLAGDEALPIAYADLRWAPPSQLREYRLDPVAAQFVDRLLAAERA
jgi:ADP-ribose pyrophosphatase YjhB (NUDIX family)